MFVPILERGTVIPASRVQRFTTVERNQEQIVVRVYQGEHLRCSQNTKLGEYTLRGLPRKPAGELSVDVRLSYDLNGLLEVDMSVVGTDQSYNLVIAPQGTHLSDAELQAARARLARLKHHPRDSLPNATAMARAEALYTQLTGSQRQVLGRQISAMSAALEVQDPLAIDVERDQLNRLVKLLNDEP